MAASAWTLPSMLLSVWQPWSSSGATTAICQLEQSSTWKRVIGMDERSTVPIVSKPSQANAKISVPVEQHTSLSANSRSSMNQVLRKTPLEPATQSCVEAVTQQYGTISSEPRQHLHGWGRDFQRKSEQALQSICSGFLDRRPCRYL